jgi:menaquinone-9 beta-reductase
MKPIHIVGGGLAGLTLGIDLCRRGVPVVVSEKGAYPRHRVCGEFISGQGRLILDAMGPGFAMRRRGARVATTAQFFSGNRAYPARRLPEPALCVSRYELDAMLAAEFVALRGELRTGDVVDRGLSGEGIVWATGRRAQPVDEARVRWIGLKVHARGVQLGTDLEMHFDESAYVGLCRVGEDVVNICGLFRAKPGEPTGISALRGRPGTTLFKRLERAEFNDESFCAVAGLCLAPQPIDDSVCRIGDALTMIPPVTGNGMSMAVESAVIAAEPLEQFAKGRVTWGSALEQVAASLKARFRSRLKWAARFHRVLFHEHLRDSMLPLVMKNQFGWRTAFQLTR